MEKHHKFSIWYVLLGIWVVLLIHNYLASALSIRTIPYSEFLGLLKEKKVTEVAISTNQIQGRISGDEDASGKGELFKTVRVDPEISKLLEQYEVQFKGQVESTFFRDLLSWVFPVFLFLGIWYFFMKRMTGRQPGFMSLGKNKAKIYICPWPSMMSLNRSTNSGNSLIPLLIHFISQEKQFYVCLYAQCFTNI